MTEARALDWLFQQGPTIIIMAIAFSLWRQQVDRHIAALSAQYEERIKAMTTQYEARVQSEREYSVRMESLYTGIQNTASRLEKVIESNTAAIHAVLDELDRGAHERPPSTTVSRR